MKFRRNRRSRPDINLIPMIDVLLVLLLFFMVASTLNRNAELSIQLPSAQGEPPADVQHIEVAIDAEGRWYIDEQEVINRQLETLKRALLAAAGDRKDPLIVLSADRRTPHEAVIAVLDAAQQLGFNHLTFATEARPEPSTP